jgi:hypothetical protein
MVLVIAVIPSEYIVLDGYDVAHSLSPNFPRYCTFNIMKRDGGIAEGLSNNNLHFWHLYICVAF